jgi:hypothetical protein
LSEGVWGTVIRLPDSLMQQARAQAEHAPVKAAVTAQLAAAIAILTVAPIRLLNLATIRLGQNLIKPGGPESRYWLVFPHYDVKNRVKLEYPLDEALTHLLNEYVHDFRAVLMREQRVLAVSRRDGRFQDPDHTERPDHKTNRQGDWIANHGASVPTCRGRSHPQASSGQL